jgi:hypothetical protein
MCEKSLNQIHPRFLSSKLIRLAFQKIIPQKSNDERFNRGILKQADSTAAHIEPAGFRAQAQTKVRIVPTPYHGVKTIAGPYFVHRVSQNRCLLVRDQLIVGSMDD